MRKSAAAAWLVIALLAAPVVTPEQPTWEDIAAQAFLIRTHDYWNPTGERTDGIWSLDPLTGATRRLRPFHFDTSTFDPGHEGRASYLSANGDLLAFESWPYYVDFEAASWRILRRYPPLADPAAAGWAVRGTIVSEEAAPLLGLEPGVYGFASCVRVLLGWYWYPCTPLDIPGRPEPVESLGDLSVLLRRGLAPDDGTVSFVAEVEPHEYWTDDDFTFPHPPVLSFDTQFHGLWRGTRRGVEFLPVIEGSFGQPSLSAEFTFPPFDDPSTVLTALLFHPVHRLFLGASVARGWENDRFFSIDEHLQLLQTYQVASPPETGAPSGLPVTLATLGPLPERRELMLPIVAHTPGASQTEWTSTAWLFNPSSEPVTVALRRVTTPDESRRVELAPHASVQLPDVLAWAGGGPDGDGVALDALVLTAPYHWGEQLVATSRTFTPAAPPGGSGTYGQAVPAVPGRLGYSNHLPLHDHWSWGPEHRTAHIDLDRRVPGRYRHNLGVVNDHPQPLRVTLIWGWNDTDHSTWHDRLEDRARAVDVAGGSVHIVNVESLFPEPIRTYWPPRVAVFADRPASIWYSMVDNLTGDATFVPFTALHWQTDVDDGRAAIPAVAHTGETNGGLWLTDLYAVQGSSPYDQPTAVIHPAQPETACGGAATQGEIIAYLQGVAGPPGWQWGPGDSVVFPDVVRLFPPCAEESEASGGLEVVTASWTTGYSRTYTTREDGGTYGEMLPFYPIGGWPVQHFAGVEVSETFRVNVGLFNGDHEHAITHRLTLYAADGRLAAEGTLTLQPLASYQRSLDHVFGLEDGTLPHGTYGLTVLPLDDDAAGVQGHCWAYVSLIDNITGDPTNWW